MDKCKSFTRFYNYISKVNYTYVDKRFYIYMERK
jgi:hypothetical protein